jgi:rhodanese-related sulfurtransferase
MPASLKEMIDSADAMVPRISIEEARKLMEMGALVVDVRDAPEIENSGKIEGAIHISRGMLEFRADPASPFYCKSFDLTKPVIVYCASGGRSALAGKVLKDMGYEKVYNLGAFKDWAQAGGRVEKPIEAGM